MANGGSIKYTVGFNVDKSGLNQLKTSLQEIQRLTAQDLMKIGGHQDINKAQTELNTLKTNVREIESAFKKAFNSDLGTLNVARFNTELKKSKLDLNTLQASFNSAGVVGQNAFRNMTTQLLTTNMQLKQTHSLLDNMATTMANTIKWGVASSVMNGFTRSVQQAYSYVKRLDTSLNDIRIVTGKSADEMEKFAIKANDAAKALGQSTTNYTEASLIYYQQGLSDKEVAARAETTLKAANVTGQTGEEVSEQLTAVWNGYKVSAEEAELYVDKLAAVASRTASNLEELSTGMSKVASAANAMGVDADQLNAQLATIVSVTRQAPESVGTALKTIYARMSDLKLGGTDEDGLGLGDVSGQMEAMGIDVLDATGNLRDMGAVIEDVAAKWDTWTEAQKTAMAQVMAGKRQYNNLVALFENWDMYEMALETSQNSAGTLQKQQDTYMESMKAHLSQLKAETEDLYDSILDPDGLNPLIDALGVITKGMTTFVDSIGGGSGMLLNFGSIGAKVFSKQIAQGIATSIVNFRNAKENAAQLQAQMELLSQFKGLNIQDSTTQKLIKWKQEIINLGSLVNAEQHNEANAIIQSTNEIQNQADAWEENKRQAEQYLKTTNIYKGSITGIDEKSQNKQGIDNELQKRINYYTEAQTKGKEYQAVVNELNAALYKQSEVVQKAVAGSTEMEKAEDKVVQALKQVKESMVEVEQQAKLRLNTLGLLDKESSEYKELTLAVKKYQAVLTSPLQDDAAIQAAAEKLVTAYQNANTKLKEQAKQTRQVVDQEARGATENFKNALTQAEQTWNSFISKLKLTQQIQQVVTLASSIGQLASVINTIINLGDIINDESLSNGEKALRIISALSMAIPMLYSGLTGIGGSLIKLASISSATAAGLIETATASGTAAGGVKALGIAIKTLATGPVGIILGIAAALAVVGVAAYKAYNKAADEAKRANEALKLQEEALNKVKEAHEELLSTIDEYKSAREAIEDLTVGTQEWVAAINEANDSVLELLNKYPELAKYVDNVNGQLIVQNEGFKELEKLQNQSIEQAQRATYGAQAYALDKQNTSDMVDMGRSIQYVNDDGSGAYSVATISEDTIRDVVEAINSSGSGFLKDVKSVQNKLNISNETLAQALVDNAAELTTLAAEVNANTTAMNLYYQSLADNYLKDNKIYQDSDNQQGIQAAYAQELEKRAKDLYDKEYKDKGKLGGGKLDEDIQEEYAKLIGATDYSNEGDNKGKYLINGAWQEIDDATARYALALEAASKEMEDFAVNLIPIVDNISTDTDIQNALLGFSYGNTADLTQLSDEQLTNLKDLEISQEEAVALGYTTAQEFMDAISEAVSNEKDRRIAESYRTAQEAANEADRLIGQTQGITAEQAKAWAEAEGAYGLSQQAGINFDDYEGLSPEEILANVDFSQMPTENLSEWWKKAIEEGAQKAELQKAEDQEMANLDKTIEDLDLDADAVQSYADNLQNVAKESEKVADGLSEDAVAAKKVAIAGTRLNKGLDELQDNFEDQKKALKNNESHTQEYAEAMDGLKKSMGDVLNIDGSALSNDFIVDNLKDIEAAANGDVEAIERLRIAAAQDIIQQVAVNIDDADLLAEMNNVTNELSNYAANHDLTIGATLDDTNFIDSLNHMITASGMTAEQVGNYLKALGYDAELSTEENTVPSTMQVPSTTYNIETDPETGMMTKMTPTTKIENVEYEQIVRTPVVKALTYTGSAGGNISHSNTKGGGATTKKGKGGGGGGGSKPKKEDKVESKKDRYHDVNVKLKQINEDLDDLGKKRKKLFGADLIKNLNQELKVLEKQKKVLNDKLKIAKEERDELKKKLQDQGVQFNDDDTIKNYAKIVEEKEKALNQMIEDFNKLSAAEQEKQQEKLEQAKEDYEKFMELIGEYEDVLLDTIPEIENQLDDVTDREIEIHIQKLNKEVEIRLDLTQAQKDWNEFKREIIDGIDSDDIFGNAKADAELFNTLMGNQTTEALTHNINTTMDQIDSINKTGTSSIYGNDKNAALENLEEQMSNLMDHMTELNDLQKQISEAYLDMVDEVGEAFDEQIESYEYVGDLINHNMELIKLVKGEDAWADLQASSKQRNNNNLQMLANQKAAVDYYRQMMETETDEKAKEKWTQMWKDGVTELKSLTKQTIEDALEDYEIAVNKIFDDLDNKMTNGKGLDYLTQEWELKNENADQYLDTINSTYEVQKLERKIQDSINNTDSLSAQKQLNKLMDDELKKLREKEKLTKYDIDRANAMYEIKLKEIALEEAQQNKSQMRLRRDASGNYSYQFVADQDSISKAQQELDDARNSLYNMDKDEYRENQQAILDVYTEFQEKMRDAANLSAEEKKLIEEQYNERINALLEENGYIRNNLMESTFADLAALYGSDVANFQQMSAEEQDILMGQIVPTWDSGIQEMIDTMVGENGFGPSCKAAMEELNLATQEYDGLLAQIQVTAGETASQLSQGYDTNIDKAKALAEAQQANIDKTIAEKDATLLLKDQVDALALSYKNVYDQAKLALEQAQKLRDHELEEAARKAAEEAGRDPNNNTPSGGNNPSGSETSNNPSSNNGKHQLTSDIIDGIAGAIWYWSPSAWGNGEERKNKINSKFGSGSYEKVQSYINDHVTVGGKMKKAFKYGWGDRDKYKQYYYSKFDTGGYTGDWAGNDGKAAILHKKELVLNANDTKNFLSAIHLVRDMESMLGALNDSMLSRTSGMTASLAPSLGFEDSAQNTVNQNVSIQASFPGVSSRAEIEDAFRNLVNIASQHAFNTQR